jgi:hypothetical protein
MFPCVSHWCIRTGVFICYGGDELPLLFSEALTLSTSFCASRLLLLRHCLLLLRLAFGMLKLHTYVSGHIALQSGASIGSQAQPAIVIAVKLSFD